MKNAIKTLLFVGCASFAAENEKQVSIKDIMNEIRFNFELKTSLYEECFDKGIFDNSRTKLFQTPLTSIDDFHLLTDEFPELKEKITEINLRHNNIGFVDFEKLFKVFPNLKTVKLWRNNFKKNPFKFNCLIPKDCKVDVLSDLSPYDVEFHEGSSPLFW